jgi:Fur family ferric uptake transcriptional regulator
LKTIFNWSSTIELGIHLREKGYRLTPQRIAVFGVLRENAGRPMTIEQIHQACAVKYPDLGLTTVYRTLEMFCETGVALQIHLHEPSQYYELNTGTHHHHLVCVECGNVEPVETCVVDDMSDVIRDSHDFVVTSHCLSLFGYCVGCSAR